MDRSLRSLPKVDAHHHLWDVDTGRYPWLVSPEPVQRIYGDSASLRFNYRLDAYLADIRNQNIVKSVHVQTGWQPDDPVGETRYLQAIADSNPGGFPHAIVGAAMLHDPDVERVLEGHAGHANARGVRVSLNWHANPAYRWADRDDYLTDEKFRRGFHLLAKFGFSLDVQVYPGQFADVAALADRDERIQLVVLHAGMPIDRAPQGMRLWRDGLRDLARRPNIAMKFCGLSMIIHDWTPEIMRAHLEQVVDAFGTDRVMIASNFPVDRLKGSFDDYYDAYGLACARFAPGEQVALFAGNTERTYRI
jgi:predicted TIM-barrel fold metal-dependent hydrolase